MSISFGSLLHSQCFIVTVDYYNHHANMLLFLPFEKGRKQKLQLTSIDPTSPPTVTSFLRILCSKAPLTFPLLNLLQEGFVHVKVTSGLRSAKPTVPSVISRAPLEAVTADPSRLLAGLQLAAGAHPPLRLLPLPLLPSVFVLVLSSSQPLLMPLTLPSLGLQHHPPQPASFP